MDPCDYKQPQKMQIMKCRYLFKKNCYKQNNFIIQPSNSNPTEVNTARMKMSG